MGRLTEVSGGCAPKHLAIDAEVVQYIALSPETLKHIALQRSFVWGEMKVFDVLRLVDKCSERRLAARRVIKGKLAEVEMHSRLPDRGHDKSSRIVVRMSAFIRVRDNQIRIELRHQGGGVPDKSAQMKVRLFVWRVPAETMIRGNGDPSWVGSAP